MEQESKRSESLKVLSDAQMIVRNSIGIKRVLNRKSFRGYLKEKGHQGKTIEQDKIVGLLQECANSRDQVLLLLLAETGFRIGELLGVRGFYSESMLPLTRERAVELHHEGVTVYGLTGYWKWRNDKR